MLKLHVVPAHGDPFDRLLEGETLIIGRSSESDLMIADRFLSRQHARLQLKGEQWFAEDLGSRNGTLLNGKRIEGSEPIKPGDDLQLCGSVISVQEMAATPTSRSDSSGLGQHTVFRRASDLIDSQAESASQTDAPDALRRYAERLKMLNDVHQALGRSIELQELLDLILDRAFDHLQPEEGVIYLKQPDGEFYRAAFRSVEGQESEYVYSRTLIHEVAEKGLAALVLDVETDERFAEARSILSSGIRSLVAAPLLDPEGTLGMVAVSSRAHLRRFAEDDMELLVSLASVAALRIRNVALAEEALERRRLEEDLKLARQIQVGLLPARLPEIAGYQVVGGNMPSRGVSGDYYVIVERNEGSEFVFMVADVSGKGIAASILTASLEALSAGPIEVGAPTEEICERVCRRLYQRTPPAKYATAFLAALQPANGSLHYTNAGHNPALVVRAGGEVEELAACGMPIGLLPEGEYTFGEITLEPGDTLVIYTDGITEAANPEEDEYGLERLIQVCTENRQKDLEELSSAIEADLQQFAEGVPFADDRTMVMVRRLAAS